MSQTQAPRTRPWPGVSRPKLGLAASACGFAFDATAVGVSPQVDSIPLTPGVAVAARVACAVLALVLTVYGLREWRLRRSGRAQTPHTFVHSTRRKVTLTIVLLFSLLAMIGGATYLLARNLVEQSVSHRLLDVATLERARIQAWIEGERADIRAWATEPDIVRVLGSLRADSQATRDAREQQISVMRRHAKAWKYAGLTVRDARTGVALLVSSEEPERPEDRRQAVNVAAAASGPAPPVVSTVAALERPDSPVLMSFFHAVSIPGGQERVVLQVDVEVVDAVFRHVSRRALSTDAADVMLVHRDGNALVVLHDSQLDAPHLASKHLQSNAQGSLWSALATRNSDGFFRGLDIGGERSAAVALPVADTPWLLVAKIDEGQLFTELIRIFELAAVLVLVVSSCGVWWWLAQRRQAAAQSRIQRERVEYADRVSELSRRLVSAQEAERRHLAMELHDRAAANLAAIQLNLKCFDQSLPSIGVDDRTLLKEANQLLTDTIISIREICVDLRPPLIEYAGLAQAVRASTAPFERRTGIQVEVEDCDLSVRFDPAVEAGLFRIVQEALQNCARHSAARKVRVGLAVRSGTLEMEIEDDGRGFDVNLVGKGGQGAGHGLLSMRDRAAFAGGSLTITSRPGAGTRIRFVMPCDVNISTVPSIPK